MATMLEQVVTLLNAGYTRKEIDVLLTGKAEEKTEEVKEVKEEVKKEDKEEVKSEEKKDSVFTDEQIAQIVQAVNKYQAKGKPEEAGAGAKSPEQSFYEKYFGKDGK